jgi:hypothetical protein
MLGYEEEKTEVPSFPEVQIHLGELCQDPYLPEVEDDESTPQGGEVE